MLSALVVGSVACIVVPSRAVAEQDWLPKSLQVHGFLSQGLISTSRNNFFGDSTDAVSADFRELGINGSWQPIPQFQASVQLVLRDAGKTDDGDVRVDYGLADYTFISTENNLLGVRAGRVPTPLGLYNDTRDVAATRPSILLPQSIYFDVNRNLSLSADGGYVYGEHRTDYGDFLLEAGGVIPRTDDPDFKQVLSFFGRGPGDVEGEPSGIVRLSYEWGGGALRLAVTYADFNATFEPDSGTTDGSFKFNPLVLSFQYNAENWTLTSEFAQRRVRLNDFRSPDIDWTGESYYVQGTYRITPSIEAMVRYDELIWNTDDTDGKKFEAATGGLVPNHTRFAKDWTFGMRWHITSSLMLSAEYHRVNGTGWLSTLENEDGLKQHWDLYAVMVSYNF